MVEKIQFFPLDVSYKVINNKPVIHLFGATTEGKQILVLDDSFEPYFYVIPKKGIDLSEKLAKIAVEKEGRIARVTRTETVDKKYLGNDVQAIKVYTKLPRDVPIIRDVIKEWEIIEGIYEYDIMFSKRYLIDKNIVPLTLYEVVAEPYTIKSKVPVFKASKIEQISTETIKPRILSFDIETYSPSRSIQPEKNPIIMLAFYSENSDNAEHKSKAPKPFKKVFIWKKFKTKLDYIEFVNSEEELIEKFKETIETFKPDVLTGYFSDGFDLPYIKTRAAKFKIKLDVGLDYSELSVSGKKAVKSSIKGIIHLDIFKFIRKIMRGSMETQAYNLNAVASELLGEKKEDVNLDELSDVWDKTPEKLGNFCQYNLNDSLLAYKLTQKMMPTIIELVKIVGLTIFDVNRMGFSRLVEGFLLKQAPNFNEIAPNKPGYDEIQKRRMQTYKGGFVYEPQPGLHKELVVFDYRSLYPTIIGSHNISPGTLNCECCEGTAKTAPLEGEDYWFCTKKKGFIPTLIEDLITRRMRIKEIIKEGQEEKHAMLDARQNSLKLSANSFYGYLGFFGARWYSIECAKATTAWGRFYIQDVIKKAQDDGFKVLYSDSLPYNRYLFIKFNNGDIKLIKIGELYDDYRNVSGLSTLSLNKNKKVIFKPITRIIRHSYNGKLLDIDTKYGSTIVTPQHSVYSFDNKSNNVCLVDAKKLKKKDTLISLTNPELKATYNKGHKFDIAKLNTRHYSKELTLYSDTLFFPKKKGKCPYCKKECTLSSHVFSKHSERRQPLNEKSPFQWVGGKIAKTRKIPRYWTLDEDLAWILGFYCADGSVSDIYTKSGRKCLLSFGSQNKKIIKKVKSILDAKTGISTKIIENYDPRNKKNMFYYRVQCVPIVALFQNGFNAGKGSEFKKVPWFIFTAEESLRKAFIKGYLDGDGQSSKDKRYATHFIRFSTKSKELAMGLDFIFKSLKHAPNYFGKKIKHVAWQYRKDKLKIQTLRLQSAKKSKGNFCLAEIRSINEMQSEKYVYDVEVEGTHNFVDAEGMILVHNTDSVFLTLDGKTKEEAKKFAEKINRELPGLMELEYEGFYPAGIFVSAKMGPFGAKKKYALLSETGTLKIKGFEMVRRNWSFIAKETQEKVLDIILKEGNKEKAMKYVKGIINKLREKKIPLDKVIIHTQLQKDLSDYTAKGPHVAVAQRLKSKGVDVTPGTLIQFVVTQGSDIIRNRAKLPEEVTEDDYDADYYINNQVVPAVDKIFEVLGYTKSDLLEHKEQKKLEGFF